MKRRWFPGALPAITLAVVAALGVLAGTTNPAWAASQPAQRARRAMVVGPEPIAVEQAVRVLRSGGNAIDAAVTMALVLAVTYPQAGNLGGGGYMLIRKADGQATVIDYRETAPAAATRGMFLDASGKPIPGASLTSYRSSGVPGTVAGLALALRKYGTRSWAEVVEPAIPLAHDGFTVPRGLEGILASQQAELARWPASRRIFFAGAAPLAEGARLVQKDLAATLRTLAREGPAAFYTGRLAEALAADMRAHDGLITTQDLEAYRALERRPLTGAYRRYEVLTTPPSSGGGVAILESLNMLAAFDLKAMGHNSSAYIHLVSEATRRAFADRSRWLGDPEFFEVPLEGLLSVDYAASRMKGYDPQKAIPADSLGPGEPPGRESPSTTHFSILDEQGNVVSNTYTLNEWFGSGAVADGLGYLLNNEMDDFAVAPGQPNLFGLTGGEANSIAPGKRMLSSMSPTILLERAPGGGAAPRLVLGTPGGSAIITSVLQVVLNVVEFDMELQAAVNAPRFHHQWLPDHLFVDKGGFPADVIDGLTRRGHDVVERGSKGEVLAILVDRDRAWIRGAADARGYGVAAGY